MSDYRSKPDPQAAQQANDTLRAAYQQIEQEGDPRGLERRARAYKPEKDAEADRLSAIDRDKLPPLTRLALAYHESAREAAAQLKEK